MTIQTNEISAVIRGEMIPGWKTYTIESDILKPADAFDMTLKFSKKAWDLCRPDSRVRIFVDDVILMDGFIGVRTKQNTGSGTTMSISGRDKSGRMVDESAPLFRYGGLGIKELAEKLCGIGGPNPIFQSVVLINTKNRNLLRKLKARRAKFVQEPGDGKGSFNAGKGPLLSILDPRPSHIPEPFDFSKDRKVERPPIVIPGIFRGRAVKKKVAPGQTRWAVLEEFLREARLLAWSVGDGSELFIGLPNYEQQPQYAFYEASIDSASRSRTNARISVSENVEESYSMYTAVGASRGSSTSYGTNVTKNRATVFNNPENKRDGTGASFLRRKALMITDDGIKNKRDALERAEREMLQREARRLEITVNVPGHSQLYSGTVPAIYAIDTMARVWDEDTNTKGEFYVVSCSYTRGRDQGTATELKLVPRGTLLQL